MTATRQHRAMHAALLVAIAIAVGDAPAAQAVDALPVEECPSAARLAAPRELIAPPDEGTIREVLTWVSLDGWRGVEGLALRIRKLTVKPGGWVPLHWHNDRPSVDYIVKGELIETNSFCAVEIPHEAGDAANRFGDFHAHWWVNQTAEDVVLVSADVVPLDQVDY